MECVPDAKPLSNVSNLDSSMDMSQESEQDLPLPPALFSKNEKVLCFHGLMVYEGKVLNVEYSEIEKDYLYRIHYNGWNNKWDENLLATRILKHTPENLKRTTEHNLSCSDSKGGKKGVGAVGTPSYAGRPRKKPADDAATSSGNVSVSGSSRPSTPTGQGQTKAGRGGKVVDVTLAANASKKQLENVEPEHHYLMKQEIQISIPERLKVILIEDWDLICRQKKLLQLPSPHTVDSILEKYLESRPPEGNAFNLHVAEVCQGLKTYFNLLLEIHLLYKFERAQFADVLTNQNKEKVEIPMTSVYGPIHLLRLFTKLGVCLGSTAIEVPAVAVLQKVLEDLFQFLVENVDEYFKMEEQYILSPPEYQKRTKS